MDYPKFIVHGKKGSFIKYGIDQQETSLKANIMPGEPGFATDDSVGVLEYVNDEGVTVREEMKPEMGDYGRVYDALYQTITHGAPNYVKESEVLTNLEILERGFEQSLSLHSDSREVSLMAPRIVQFLNRGVNFHPLSSRARSGPH
ncbi:Gfo/Idh/MocA family oxidoreductase [Escherichia coli]